MTPIVDVFHAEWMKEGLCVPPSESETLVYNTIDSIFFEGDEQTISEKAMEWCAKCPVRSECLSFAIKNSSLEGVWGGTTKKQRIAMRRRQLRVTCPACHSNLVTIKEEEEFCIACGAAWDIGNDAEYRKAEVVASTANVIEPPKPPKPCPNFVELVEHDKRYCASEFGHAGDHSYILTLQEFIATEVQFKAYCGERDRRRRMAIRLKLVDSRA